MGTHVERIRQKIEWGAKDLFVRLAPPIVGWLSSDSLERCNSTISSFVVGKIPTESLRNSKFAIRTILESKGRVVNKDEVEELAKETTRNFITYLIENLSILQAGTGTIPWPKFVEPKISDEVKAFLSQRGIIASFHSGNPFAAANFFRELVTKDVAVFMERQPVPIQDRLVSFAKSFRLEPVFVDDEPRKMYKKIMRSDFLVTLFDRPPKEGEDAVTVDFFGKPTRFPKGLAVFSLILGRPILPVAVVKINQSDQSYTAKIGNIVFPKDYREIKNIEEKGEEITRITRAVVAELEPIIAEHITSFYFDQQFLKTGLTKSITK